jgi:NitT/TauT family transport system ATP-binding protein
MTTPILVVDGVSKAFRDADRALQALQPVSFSLADGEFVCLLGPSGSGKSTLLRIVGGLATTDTGRMWFAGQPHSSPRTEIGFVFQRTNLMPWRTVLQNVLLPLEIQQGRVRAQDRERAVELLDVMGLAGFEHAYPRQLSGGMNQRVVLARTLIQQPRLLLMDEPFGQLDAMTRERLNLELLRIHSLQSQTILMVTHSIGEAILLADRVLVLSQRPGRIVGAVAIDLPRPRDLALATTPRFGELVREVRQCIGEAAFQE